MPWTVVTDDGNAIRVFGTAQLDGTETSEKRARIRTELSRHFQNAGREFFNPLRQIHCCESAGHVCTGCIAEELIHSRADISQQFTLTQPAAKSLNVAENTVRSAGLSTSFS